MNRNPTRVTHGFAAGFHAVSREERRQSELFYASLMGYAPRSGRRLSGRAETDESFAEKAPIKEGPLTDSEWRTVLMILNRGEADVGVPLTNDADRNALLVAARIFCDRNAMNLGPGDPLLCLIPSVTATDPRVRALARHVGARGPIGDWAVLMRAVGLAVNESVGWRTRAAQGGFAPIGIIMHHTVGVSGGTLADIVTNTKANFFVDRAGVVTIVAGGRANHAGKGAQQVLDEVARGVAPIATASARGLPNGPVGNGHFYGFENENRGDGVQPWPEVQLNTMATAAAALCRRHGWTANRVIGHKEWTSRKPVCPFIDMAAFRARVASLL